MKIGVVGSFVLDTVIDRGAETVSLGGINYNLVSLAAALPDAEIVPVASADPQVISRIKDVVEQNPNINTEYLLISQNPVHRNTITLDGQNRTERFWPGHTTVPDKALEVLLDADGVVVNMISPWDVSVDTARSFAARFRGLIHLDVHSLVRDVDPRGFWAVKPVKDHYKWIRTADTLQMNREEAQAFTGLDMKEPDDAKRACMLLVLSGAKACAITLGSAGAAVAQAGPDGIRAKLVSAPDSLEADPPGSGDVFSSWFFRGLMQGQEALDAAEAAVKKATEFVKKRRFYHGHERG